MIALNGEDNIWVVGGPGMASQLIVNHNLSFEAKMRWTLARQRLRTTTGDNILSPVYPVLISSLMARYKFDVDEFLA